MSRISLDAIIDKLNNNVAYGGTGGTGTIGLVEPSRPENRGMPGRFGRYAKKNDKADEKPQENHEPGENFIKLPKVDWVRVPPRRFVGYYNINGEWESGGFVDSIGADSIKLRGGTGKSAVSFTVPFSFIKSLYLYQNPGKTYADELQMRISNVRDVDDGASAGQMDNPSRFTPIENSTNVPIGNILHITHGGTGTANIANTTVGGVDAAAAEIGSKILYGDIDLLTKRVYDAENEIKEIKEQYAAMTNRNIKLQKLVEKLYRILDDANIIKLQK